MEEREALKRQIELLQDLINKHKSVHGDAPVPAAEQRQPEVSTTVRAFNTSAVHPHISRGRPYAPQSRGSWRKTYSLRNNCPQSTVPAPSAVPSTSLYPATSQYGTSSISATISSTGHEPNSKAATSLSGNLMQKKKTGPETCKTTNSPTLPSLSKESKHSPEALHGQVNVPFLKKSKFTWVKSQTVSLEPKAASSVSIPMSRVTASQTSVLKAAATAGSLLSGGSSKKTPPRKFPRKLSPVTVAPRTSKYRWVSSSGVQTKNQRKPLSPKALINPQRDVAKKLKPASTPSGKPKRGIAASSASLTHMSRYRWKAGGQTAAGSAFHWTAEKSSKGLKMGHPSPTAPQRAYLRSSSPAGFKLCSRMKIIRKSGSRYIYTLIHPVIITDPIFTISCLTSDPMFIVDCCALSISSRAVQRSIAIIRHARQKKQQKQYCMYYNRFGKCNRGTSCPFIHDPDKVAVCTRFLRGTCKQADGTCPFSHKVAKEKMPVCSYFLKGICNNSDCPYSHVYVSRKAEVCDDFVKGYCPEGEKCKKKHTLVCPDFSKTGSCPRGSRCKLQHRQRVKRSASSTSTIPAKKSRILYLTLHNHCTLYCGLCKSIFLSCRPHLSVVMPENTQAASGRPIAGPLALPSFISLSSSPEEADAPDSPQADATQVKGINPHNFLNGAEKLSQRMVIKNLK
uniref:Zinc finger CCCH domain-containing protein 3 n=1 Tax=Xiphophorus couchianus TaxID=32473 RepID=A0A3B5L7T1_9TELE